MSNGKSIHSVLTVVLSLVMAVVGITILVVTFSRGGGALARGVIVGALFLLVGVGRTYITLRRGKS